MIEVAIPLAAISVESAKQKNMGAAPHPQNLHRWWARRPLAACRAVLFAQLVDDPSSRPEEFPTEDAQNAERERLFDIMRNLIVWEKSHDVDLLSAAHREIARSCDGELPRILDPFAGGGAIPIESLRLGLPTASGDLNPVAVLIQRAMLEIPQRFMGMPPVNPVASPRGAWVRAEGLAADVEYYGRWMLEEARRRIGRHFPDVTLDDGTTAMPVAWIWARTVKSPDPSWPGHVPLVRSWTLSAKKGKPPVWVKPVIDEAHKQIRFEIQRGGSPHGGSVKNGKGVCIATGTAISGEYIKLEASAGRMSQSLVAVVCESNSGRTYVEPTGVVVPELPGVSSPIDGPVPRHLSGGSCSVYGLDSWMKLFTARQLLALTTFSDLVDEAREQVLRDAVHMPSDSVRLRDGGLGREGYADAIATYLSFVIDQCSDFWSSICSWNSTNEQIRNTFARQALPMTWDFAEVNPFSGKVGSWESMLHTVKKGILALPMSESAHVSQRDARARISEVGTCVLATDPPYYDNIFYADLSDFFYVWMRRNLREIWPSEMATLLTPKAEELIANRHRAGSKEAAQAHFELGMQGVFQKAAECADERYPATVFYAFKATELSDEGEVSTGWETFLAGLIEAGFAITATWPVRTEKPGKIGMAAGDNMLASSIVLACRKRPTDAPMATRSEFLTALRRELPAAVKVLQAENIAPVDMAQSAIGPGMQVFSRYSKVVESSGEAMPVRRALVLINEALSEVLTGEESELDADTRFALTWFEQFGLNPGPFGDADVLARAKDTTVDGVCASGIAMQQAGKVRLVERDELPGDWDPTADTRLTVWEIAQHLVRRLEESESHAARLLQKVGIGMGERAKQLAYLLFTICEKKRLAAEALPYDTLVQVWPELVRRAMAGDFGDAPGGRAAGGEDELEFGEE